MDFVDASAIIVSICALFLALYEGRQAQKSFREQVYQGFVSSWFELDKLFINNPELRKYFYEGTSLSRTDPNYLKVICVAEYFDDAFAYSKSQADVIPANLRESYRKYREKVEKTPAFRVYRKQNEWVNTGSN
jgi:hypothetical protein